MGSSMRFSEVYSGRYYAPISLFSILHQPSSSKLFISQLWR